MSNKSEQLAYLRERIATIELRFAQRTFETPPRPIYEEHEDLRSRIEEWADGEVVANSFGEHFQTERLFRAHKQHGAVDIGSLAELRPDLLEALGEDPIPAVACDRWAFLDTETTGLSLGPGAYAFLIGIGRITRDGFQLRQFFMRAYSEERSLLAAVDDYLSGFDVLVTYNGKTYDQPLLEARYQILGHKSPFDRLAHVDVLHGARRLWKLRMQSCRLIELEQQILGVCRDGDLPGELIPYVYFEYLRSQEAFRLLPIFHHNAIDILTLACFTAIVPAAFRQTDAAALARLGVRRGEDLCGIGRWLIAVGKRQRGLDLLKQAIDAGLPDRLLFRTLWDIALLEKKLGSPQAAREVFTELTGCRNEYRSLALEELAKYYEHEERNLRVALELTSQAFAFGESEALRRRKERLERRIARVKTRSAVEC